MAKVQKEQLFDGRHGASIMTSRHGMWYFRIWLDAENKYLLRSLKTKNKAEARIRGEQQFIEVMADKQKGIRYHSISTKEAVEKYLDYRRKGVGTDIVEGRFIAIGSHLKHFLEYVHKDERIGNLGRSTLTNYEREGIETDYVKFRRTKHIADTTIRNEIATINAMIKYLYEEENGRIASVPSFNIPKLQAREYKADGSLIRRQTFTGEEWQAFYEAMRSYVEKTKQRLSEEAYLSRQLARHYFLFAANSGMRSSELRFLTFNNVSTSTEEVMDKWNERKETRTFAKVFVHKDTTKVRIPRTFICDGGQYIDRWKTLLQKHGIKPIGYVFSLSETEPCSKYVIRKGWERIMAIAKIDDARKAELVPYSLRHKAITDLAFSGVSFEDIGQHCGTSTAQIERTYYHLNEAKMKSVARARYIAKDGIIVPAKLEPMQ